MSALPPNALRDMEMDIWDVADWSEVLHMLAAGLDESDEREALQLIARTVLGLGRRLREQWQVARQEQRAGTSCA